MKALKFILTAIILLLAVAAVVCPTLMPGECASLVALAQLEKPYVFNTEGPNTFDCSGLVLFAYGTLGQEVEHWAYGISTDEKYPSFDAPAKGMIGDLIFFDTNPKTSNPADHVGMLIGENRFVHASSSGKRVMISELDEKWLPRVTGGKRLADYSILLPFSKPAAESDKDR